MAIHQITQEFKDKFNISEISLPIKGGQKNVYLVKINGEKYALKLFHSLGKDARTLRELKIYEEFKELNGIPKIIKIDEFEGELVIFEEFIEGNDLRKIAKQYFKDERKINELLNDLCYILKPIWEREYVHRDIKPENIIIRPDDSPVLLDFGIARDLNDDSITGTGVQPLSYLFGSPEQYAGNKDLISYKTDFFSLGVLAYFLYYQRYPFGDNRQSIATKFKSRDESFYCEEACMMKNFYKETLKFSPSERPRRIEDLIKLI